MQNHVIFYLLLVIISSSCIRDEAPNAEADILSCKLPEVVMTTHPIINNNSVTLLCRTGNGYFRTCTGVYSDSGSNYQSAKRNCARL